MKSLIFFVLSFVVFLSANATTTLDSLFTELRNHPTKDSTRIKILSSIGFQYKSINHLTSIKYYKEALTVADHLASDSWKGKVHNAIGEVYTLTGDSKNAITNYLRAAELFQNVKEYDEYFRSLNSIATLYLNLGDVQKAEEYFEKESAFLESITANVNFHAHYDLKASILMAKEEMDSVIFYYKKSLPFSVEDKDYQGIQATYCNIGLIFNKMARYDSADFYIRKALNLNTYPITNDYNIASAYSFLGDNYACLGNISKAKEMYDSSNFVAKRCNSWTTIVENYLYMSDMFAQQKDYLNQAFYLSKHYQLKDSLFGIEKHSQLNQIEQNFTQQLNEKELNYQKQQKTVFIIVSLILLLLVIIIFFIGYKTKQKNILLKKQKDEIEQQRNEISIQKQELLQLNQTKDRLFKIISHDLRNPLIALSQHLEISSNPSLPAQDLLESNALTAGALHQSISLLDNLLTWAYAQIGPQQVRNEPLETPLLVEEVLTLVKPQAEHKKISFKIHIEKEAEVVVVDKNMIQVVLRNLITNAIKYSNKQGNIEIQAQRISNQIVLTISDFGIGMNRETLDKLKQKQIHSTAGTANEKGTGLGLTIVFDLLHKMNIPYEIESEEHAGTRFQLVLNTL